VAGSSGIAMKSDDKTTPVLSGRQQPPVLDGDTESDSSMVRRQGRFMRWLSRTFFGAVRFDESNIDAIRIACSAGTPVFVMDAHSRLDYLYFNYAFARFGLPLVFFANEISMSAFRPMSQYLRRVWMRLTGRGFPPLPDSEMMRAGLGAGRPCMIFLKRPKALSQWGAEYRISYLKDLVEIQSEVERPLMIIPLLLVWEQKPESYRRSVLDFVFGDPQAPGALRKALSFIWNFRSAHAQVGSPIDLRSFVQESPDRDPDAVAVRLKFAIAETLLRESRAIRGPVLKGRGVMVDEIMRTRPFKDAVTTAGAQVGLGPAASIKKAGAWLRNMAADFSVGWLDAFGVVLAVIFQRRFTGISVDTAGLARIREVGKNAPVVLVPSRRSILDYFVYSFVFYTHGLIPPHVAVREQRKLNFVKPVLRRTGAFFVRHRIGSNPVYERTLRQYVRKLVKEGYWLEFFIEGSRSRSGKLQPPRGEILSMVVDAVASGAAPDVWLVPCSVTYERIVEGSFFERERRGDKSGIGVVSLANIMKRARNLGSRFGQLYMKFGEPVSMTAWLGGQGVAIPLEDGASVDPMLVRRLGYSLMWDINSRIVVTPQNLVAFVLMTTRARGIPRPVLVEQTVELYRRIAIRGGLFSDRLDAAMLPGDGKFSTGAWRRVYVDWRDTAEMQRPGLPTLEAPRITAIDGLIEEVLGVFAREGAVKVSGEGFDSVISVVERHRAWLEYYKNGIVHFFLPQAIVATAVESLAAADRMDEQELHRRTRDLTRLFRLEFVYDKTVSMLESRSRTVDFFVDEGLLVRVSDGIQVNRMRMDEINWYSEILRPFVDSYRVLATVVMKAPARADRDEIIAQAMKDGRRAWEIGEVDKVESVSPVIFKNAYKLMQDEVANGRQPDMKAAAVSAYNALPETRRRVKAPLPVDPSSGA